MKPFEENLGEIKATCLDQSRRGKGIRGIYLVLDKKKKRHLIVKCYGEKRTPMQIFFSKIADFLSGRSFGDNKTRYHVEKKCMEIWREHGFEVFCSVADFPQLAISVPYHVMEHVPGITLLDYFASPHVPEKEKLELFCVFLPEWGRRHKLALDSGDPFLIQEHPSFKHIFKAEDGRLIYFDFETVYSSRHSMESLVAKEIAGYVRSLMKILPDNELCKFMELLARHYPYPDFLDYPYKQFFRSSRPITRLLHSIQRKLPRGKKKNSKYNAALLLRNRPPVER